MGKLIFLSYFGPEEAASGVRAGRLVQAAVRAGFDCTLVHGAPRAGSYQWANGTTVQRFRRSAVRAARFDVDQATSAGYSLLEPRWRRAARAIVRPITRLLLQPEDYVVSNGAFVRCALQVIDRVSSPSTPIVIASCPPWSTALAAIQVARRRDIDLVVDLQDLWATNPVAHWPPGGKRRALRWERQLLSHARGYLFVNDRIRARWAEQWRWLADRPGVVAPIGFDGPIPERLSVAPGHALTVGYFGSIYGDRDLLPLLSACEQMEPAIPRPAVHWYGRLLGSHPLTAAVDRHVASGTLVVHPPVTHTESRRLMASFDFLLTVPSPSYPEELTTKLYDYLTQGRPIIGLAPAHSYLQEFLRDSRTGTCFSPSDPGQVARFLATCYREGFRLRPDAHYLDAHSSSQLAPALASVIAQVQRSRIGHGP